MIDLRPGYLKRPLDLGEKRSLWAMGAIWAASIAYLAVWSMWGL